MDNTEEYVSYSQALKLKKMGFDSKCLMFYAENIKLPMSEIKPFAKPKNWNDGENYSAPTLYQAQKWFREVKNADIVIEPQYENNTRIGYDWNVYGDCSGEYKLRGPLPFSETYEDALSSAITACCDFII